MIGVKEVVLKSRKVRDEFCTVCETFLTGNGSIVYPWKCECGTYECNWSSGWQHPKSESKQENK